MIANFNRFQISLTKAQALSTPPHGRCDLAIAHLLKVPNIARQLAKLPDDDLAAELKEYGAWDETELSDRYDNELRILWLAAGQIKDDLPR